MFVYANPELVSMVFTFFTIGSNVLSNIWLGRSTYSLFFMQMAYQISHAYQDANSFTKHHRMSFFDFDSSYHCFTYSQCQYATYASISCSIVFIILSAAALKRDWKIKVIVVEVGFGSVFLLFLSLFEWVLLPSISNSLYLYSSFSEKMPVILGSFAAIISLTALVVSSHALRKKFHNKNDEKDGTYAEKIGINLLFIAISGTNFAISTGAVSSQGTVLIAGYLLLLVSFLIYKRSQDGRGMISQIRNVNLGCQAICFLWLASMLQNNLFADNLTDSIITVLIVTLDPVFILIELILLLKYPLPNDHGQDQFQPGGEGRGRRIGQIQGNNLNNPISLNSISFLVDSPANQSTSSPKIVDDTQFQEINLKVREREANNEQQPL